jgi:hypothetical protein
VRNIENLPVEQAYNPRQPEASTSDWKVVQGKKILASITTVIKRSRLWLPLRLLLPTPRANNRIRVQRWWLRLVIVVRVR